MAVSYKTFIEQARKPHASPYTYMYFPITYPLSYLLFLLGFTANGISILSIVTSFIGAYFVLRDSVTLGILIFLVSYLFDFCDGNVARARTKLLSEERSEASKKRGILYENLYANVSYFLFFFSLGYYFFINYGNIWYFILPNLAYGAKIIARYTALHLCMINRTNLYEEGVREVGQPLFKEHTFLSHLKYFFKRVVDSARLYYLSFLIAAIVFPNALLYFFIGYCILVLMLNLLKIILIMIRITS